MRAARLRAVRPGLFIVDATSSHGIAGSSMQFDGTRGEVAMIAQDIAMDPQSTR